MKKIMRAADVVWFAKRLGITEAQMWNLCGNMHTSRSEKFEALWCFECAEDCEYNDKVAREAK